MNEYYEKSILRIVLCSIFLFWSLNDKYVFVVVIVAAAKQFNNNTVLNILRTVNLVVLH